MHRYERVQERAGLVRFVLMAAGAAFADNSKISPDLLPLLANPLIYVDVIVQYNSPPQTCNAGGLLGAIVCLPVNLLGGVVRVVFSLINAVSGTLLAGDGS